MVWLDTTLADGAAPPVLAPSATTPAREGARTTCVLPSTTDRNAVPARSDSNTAPTGTRSSARHTRLPAGSSSALYDSSIFATTASRSSASRTETSDTCRFTMRSSGGAHSDVRSGAPSRTAHTGSGARAVRRAETAGARSA